MRIVYWRSASAGSRFAAVLLGLGVLAFAATGCKPEPQPGTIGLVGDSISLQAVYASGPDAQPAGMEVHVGLGWEASDVLPWVRDQVAHGRPATLVVALGTNDANPHRGGWTQGDSAVWADLLGTPHESACVVVVLPALGSGARSDHVAQVEVARTSIADISARRVGPTIVADWRDVIDHDPSVLADDGVHLAGDSGGPDANVAAQHAVERRMRLYREGIERCPVSV